MRSSIALICCPSRSNESPVARQRHALAEVARADPVGDGGDIADPAGHVVREHQSADEPEQPGDDQRKEKRALERRPEGEAFSDQAAAHKPLAAWQPVRTDFAACGLG